MGADHSGAMVALFPTPDISEQLAVDGGEPVEDLHVTLAYIPGTDEEDPGAAERLANVVKEWAETQAPLSGNTNGMGQFLNGESPVTYVNPDIPGLPEVRQSLVLALEANGFEVAKDHGFTPHITIDYSDLIDYTPPSLPLDFATVSSVYQNARTDIPLGVADTMDSEESPEIATYNVVDFPTLEECVNALMASVPLTADGESLAPDTVDDVQEGGAFVIPVLIPEELDSGDGRTFDQGSLTTRDLPIPLLWQVQSDDGHDGSVIVGRIDTVDRIGGDALDGAPPAEFATRDGVERQIGGLGNARGVFDTGPYGREAERLVRAKMLRGVSADLDKFKASVDHDEPDESELAGSEEDPAKEARDVIENDKVSVAEGRVMAATLVPKPAFQECYIQMEDEMPTDDIGDVADGEYTEDAPADEAIAASLASIAASAAPVHPPKSWFENPKLTGPTPLTVADDGRVFGHIAAWNVDHIGLPMATRPPRSASNYAYFRTGVLRTEEGDDIAVGQLTLAGGHAPLSANATSAVKHYDDTASAVADVSAGEDRYGIWVSGGLRPGVTADQVRTLRASAPSGDWRPINNRLELVAVCQVNVPGFPVARTMIAGGAVTALVAAGARALAELRDAPMKELETRLNSLERDELQRRRAAALARIQPIAEARSAALTASIEAARARIAPSRQAKQAEKDALVAAAAGARARLVAAGLHLAPRFEDNKHPRDNEGKFKEVLGNLADMLKDVNGAGDATDALTDAKQKADAGDMQGAKDAAGTAKARLGDAVANASDEVNKKQLDDASSTLSDALHSLAEVATDEGEGESFGDLPPEIQEALQKAFQQATSGVDPSHVLDAGLKNLEQYIKGSGFMSPEAIARTITRWLKERITPN